MEFLIENNISVSLESLEKELYNSKIDLQQAVAVRKLLVKTYDTAAITRWKDALMVEVAKSIHEVAKCKAKVNYCKRKIAQIKKNRPTTAPSST